MTFGADKGLSDHKLGWGSDACVQHSRITSKFQASHISALTEAGGKRTQLIDAANA